MYSTRYSLRSRAKPLGPTVCVLIGCENPFVASLPVPTSNTKLSQHIVWARKNGESLMVQVKTPHELSTAALHCADLVVAPERYCSELKQIMSARSSLELGPSPRPRTLMTSLGKDPLFVFGHKNCVVSGTALPPVKERKVFFVVEHDKSMLTAHPMVLPEGSWRVPNKPLVNSRVVGLRDDSDGAVVDDDTRLGDVLQWIQCGRCWSNSDFLCEH